MIDKHKQDNERKIIMQSHPFKSAKSEAIFRLRLMKLGEARGFVDRSPRKKLGR